MKLLALDTSTIACSVALQNGHEVTSIHKIAPMQQAQLILAQIQELLAASELTLNQLDAIVFGCGPGSFTGIRIASSVAQGIGFAAELPIIRISSLAAIAQAAYDEHQLERLLVAVDARMEQVYWGMYAVNEDNRVQLCGQEQTSAPGDVQLPTAGVWSGVGDGWLNYEAILSNRLGFKPQVIHSSQLPTAVALLKLAEVKAAKRDWVDAQDALPDYLR